MKALFNLLARGTRSLSFERRQSFLNFAREDYKPKIKLREPRSPEEIMRAAWEDVGNRMWKAIGEVKREYGSQFPQ